MNSTGESVRSGDLVQHKDPLCGWGIIINMRVPWPNIEVLWSDGEVELIDSHDMEVICEGG